MQERWIATEYDSKSGQGETALASAAAPAADDDDDSEIGHKGSATREELAERFGVSTPTLDRVKTMLDQATPEQIQEMREKSEAGEKPGVRTIYEQVQSEKLKSKLQTEDAQQEVRRDNLKLFNKDFRVITRDEIPDG